MTYVTRAESAARKDIDSNFSHACVTDGSLVLIITVKRRLERGDFKCMIRAM